LTVLPPEARTATALYLHPGQIAVSDRPLTISTVLGSCVAVCLWDEARGTGGMNHYLLPVSPKGSASARYADHAVPELVARVRSAGGGGALVAKVFGGACVIEAFHHDQLGDRNVEAARELLRRAGVPIVAEDVGGRRGRKLHFCLADGRVAVRVL